MSHGGLPGAKILLRGEVSMPAGVRVVEGKAFGFLEPGGSR
jgi:hypothetical protein